LVQVVEFDAHKKTKQQDSYLGSGGYSEGWKKNAPMTKAINEA